VCPLVAPKASSCGHIYEFQEEKDVKINTVHTVGDTIGKATFQKYLSSEAPSNIAASLVLAGIASKAFLNMNAEKIEAINGRNIATII